MRTREPGQGMKNGVKHVINVSVDCGFDLTEMLIASGVDPKTSVTVGRQYAKECGSDLVDQELRGNAAEMTEFFALCPVTKVTVGKIKKAIAELENQ